MFIVKGDEKSEEYSFCYLFYKIMFVNYYEFGKLFFKLMKSFFYL